MTASNWRIDVLANYGTRHSILELKRWRGPATQAQTSSQLATYRTYAAARGLLVDANTELNVPQPGGRIAWSTSFVDSGLHTYCVWADPNPVFYGGNVYFAPIEETPEDVRVRTPGCSLYDERPKVPIAELQRRAAALVVAATIAAALKSLEPIVVPDRQSVQIYNYQSNNTVRWQVVVPRDPSRDTTVRLYFGDGAYDDATVSRGSGFVTIDFAYGQFWVPEHTEGTYDQQATLMSTGKASQPSTTLVFGDTC